MAMFITEIIYVFFHPGRVGIIIIIISLTL